MLVENAGFFAKVEGRPSDRQDDADSAKAMTDLGGDQPVFYVADPDSEP